MISERPANWGDTVTATCTMLKGDPPIQIEWALNGEPISHDYSDISIATSRRVSLLTIDAVTASHAGGTPAWRATPPVARVLPRLWPSTVHKYTHVLSLSLSLSLIHLHLFASLSLSRYLHARYKLSNRSKFPFFSSSNLPLPSFHFIPSESHGRRLFKHHRRSRKLVTLFF